MSSNIIIKTLTPNLVPKVIESISKSFSVSTDPFTKTLKLNEQDWQKMAGVFVERASHKDLSLVAIDKNSNEVIGCILNEDWKEKEPQSYYDIDQKWNPVKSIFHELHHRYKDAHPKKINFGEVLHSLYFTCVVPSARGKGVIKDLWNVSYDHARSQNFQYQVCETSSKPAENLCDHLGFQPISTVSYNNYRYKGDSIYSGLTVDPNFQKLTIWEKKIPSNLY
ncbi:hypothetical protein DLAC_11638 [Tieghemostelium lacteum]|uniref:N-acetyltransferase domain-containing protein n=1 Tax=Tieghemostelium lacteum TaxID=361077 RepID=A0A151ZGZ9_TIELA|nr:hypothetical protein DLAC_11638 [Tieghemostelium lacteum]|eukprot:KYQ93150.1 hypothetical protein DLAC_11638 [Tieghemostelium lacteum]